MRRFFFFNRSILNSSQALPGSFISARRSSIALCFMSSTLQKSITSFILNAVELLLPREVPTPRNKRSISPLSFQSQLLYNHPLVPPSFDMDRYRAVRFFSEIIDGGQHNEQLWREGFTDTYLWLFSWYIYDIGENHVSHTINIFPNPVSNQFRLPELDNKHSCQLIIICNTNSYVYFSKSAFPSKNYHRPQYHPDVGAGNRTLDH